MGQKATEKRIPKVIQDALESDNIRVALSAARAALHYSAIARRDLREAMTEIEAGFEDGPRHLDERDGHIHVRPR